MKNLASMAGMAVVAFGMATDPAVGEATVTFTPDRVERSTATTYQPMPTMDFNECVAARTKDLEQAAQGADPKTAELIKSAKEQVPEVCKLTAPGMGK